MPSEKLLILQSRNIEKGLGWVYPLSTLSLLSGRGKNNNRRLCAMEPRLRLEKFPPPAGLEPRTTITASQRLTY